MNGTNEAPDLWVEGEWYQTHFSYGFLSYMWWGGFVSIYNQSLIKINVPPPAYGWDFGTYYSNESHQHPLKWEAPCESWKRRSPSRNSFKT